MKSLLVVAHGSRRAESNDEVRDLVKKIAGMQHSFLEIKAAFLELAEPLIPEGIRQLIKNGAKEVVIMPYFLSAGRHVTKDIPADVKTVQDEYPDIKISIAPYLGASDEIREILLKQSILYST